MIKTLILVSTLVWLTACTNRHDFRLKQVDQSFAAARESKSIQEFKASVGKDKTQAFQAAQEVKHQFDLLWVIDNSASMEPSQEKLRQGLTQFATKYLRPEWDIQIAVITTDVYLAHPAFQNFLSTPHKGTIFRSDYIKNKLQDLPAANATEKTSPSFVALFDATTGKFKSNLKPTDIIPSLGPDYAKLLPGTHDGPLPALCFDGYYEGFGRIYKDPVYCAQRETVVTDKEGVKNFKSSGAESCLRPKAGESSITQCVNTLLNDTIHSGKPILATIPPKGQAGDAAWTAKLADNFMINASVGTSGSGSERGFSSLQQFLADNEKAGSETRFFRPGSKRLIVFITDEDDQSMKLPKTAGPEFDPSTSGYQGKCQRKLEGQSYTLSTCPKSDELIAVKEFKEELDRFFQGLDGSTSAPNYTVATIVPMSWATLKELRSTEKDGTPHQDYGRRYLELVNLVKNESSAMDIAEKNYSTILDRIGKVMAQGFKRYTLDPAPTEKEKLTVLVSRDGQLKPLPPAAYTLQGAELTLTDEALIDQFQASDKLVVQYDARRVSKFPLEREPTAEENVQAHIRHRDGSMTALSGQQFRIKDKELTITDEAVVNALLPDDELKIKFESRVLNQYVLTRAPTREEEMIVKIVRGDGTQLVLAMSQYEVQGKTLIITDPSITSTLKATDQVLVNYQPKTIQ